jgi:hypothetical protein
MPPCRCVRFRRACHHVKNDGLQDSHTVGTPTYLEPANFTVRHLGAHMHPLRVSIYTYLSVRHLEIFPPSRLSGSPRSGAHAVLLNA